MTLGYRRGTAAILGSLVAVLACWFLPVVSAGAAEGACSDAEGVTVVVDFGPLGGGVTVRCAPGAQASGLAALAAAGFAVEQPVSTPGFVCRIAGKPAPADESCIDTPPVTAYWSYWHADRGGSWQLSATGASRQPPQGSVDGWSFAKDAAAGSPPPPSVAPPPPETATAPTTTSTSTSTTTTSTTTTTAPATNAAEAAPITTVDPTTTTTTAAATTTTVATATTTTFEPPSTTTGPPPPTTGAPQTTVVLAAPSSAGGEPPIGLLIGGALIASVGGGAFYVASRRRASAGEAGEGRERGAAP